MKEREDGWKGEKEKMKERGKKRDTNGRREEGLEGGKQVEREGRSKN